MSHSFVFKNTITAIGLALGLVATAATSQAAYTVTFENVGPGNGGSAGQYNWHDNGGAPVNILYTPSGNGSSSSQHFVAFCIQTNQFISAGSSYTNYTFAALENAPLPGAGMGSTRADNVRMMWATYRSTLDTGTAAVIADKSAAFQYAVWYLTNQSPVGTMSGAVQGYFTTFTDESTWGTQKANLIAMVSDDPNGNQDQVLELTGGGGNLEFVPAPPALILLLAGIVPGFALRRRLIGSTA